MNCETDFVAKNDNFQTFAQTLANQALSFSGATESLDVTALLNQPFPNSPGTGKEALAELIAKIRENIVVKRGAILQVQSGVIGR